MDEFYKGYIRTNNKKSIEKFKNREKFSTYEEIKDEPEFAGILADDAILVDLDDGTQAELLMNIVEALQLNCKVYQTTRGKHFLFKNHSIGKCYTHTTLACGLTADIKVGLKSSYEVVKFGGKERFVEWDRDPAQPYDELPKWLCSVKWCPDFLNMKEGDGRNQALFDYRLTLQAEGLTKEEIKGTLRIINRYVLKEPLDDAELEMIIRDDAFINNVVQSLEYISASDLLNMDIEPIYFAVKDFLPMGLSIMASPPKYGKSYLCTQLSIAVASGSDFIGFQTNESGVLYMALEDSFNRCKERLVQELQGKPAPRNLDIMIDCATIRNGLVNQLQEYITKHQNTKLIIIDTFAKVRDGAKSNEGAYGADYREASLLKKFADNNRVAVLLVHHTRKMKDVSDPFANISGTQGLTGACDTMFVLDKESRTSDMTKLSITGRDVCQNEYAISRDKETGIWNRHSESVEEIMLKNDIALKRFQYINGNLRKTILQLMDGKEQWVGRCTEIIHMSKQIGIPITESAQKLAKDLEEINSFMVEEDGLCHILVKNGTGAKTHRFERFS